MWGAHSAGGKSVLGPEPVAAPLEAGAPPYREVIRSQSQHPPRKTLLNCRDALTSRGFAVVRMSRRRRLLQMSDFHPPRPGHPAPGPVPGAPRTQLRPAGPHLPRCEAADPADSSRYNIGENLPLPPHPLPPACFRDLLLLFVCWKHVWESRAPTGGGVRAGAGCQSQAVTGCQSVTGWEARPAAQRGISRPVALKPVQL